MPQKKKLRPQTALEARSVIVSQPPLEREASVIIACIDAVRAVANAFELSRLQDHQLRQAKRALADQKLDATVEIDVTPRSRFDGPLIARTLLGEHAAVADVDELVSSVLNADRAWVLLEGKHGEKVLLTAVLDFTVLLRGEQPPTWYAVTLACGAQGFESLPLPTEQAWKDRGRTWNRRRNKGQEWTAPAHCHGRLWRAAQLRGRRFTWDHGAAQAVRPFV